MLVHSIVSETTKTQAQVNHDKKNAVIRWRNPKLTPITLVSLQGHSFGVTRTHELPEATLDPKGAPADHSAILAGKTNWNQLFRLKSSGGTVAPLITLHYCIDFYIKKYGEKERTECTYYVWYNSIPSDVCINAQSWIWWGSNLALYTSPPM